MRPVSPFVPAQTIPDVIFQLEEIIQWCKDHNSRLGYFPVLYQSVTRAVEQGIVDQRFADGERMERLDVIFANRYLQAWHQYQTRGKPTEVWRIAFEQSERRKLTVLHHLFLGINAHINLDLGIAAAQTSPGYILQDLEEDFVEINRLLFEMVDGVQEKLRVISPLMRWIDRAFGRLDEKMAQSGLKASRENAWRVALRYAEASVDEEVNVIREEDQRAAFGASLLANPGLQGRLAIWLLRLGEKKLPPAQIIELLRETKSPDS